MGRLITVDVPGSNYFDQDVTNAYDNLSRLTQVSNPLGHNRSYAYDPGSGPGQAALGRVTSETSFAGTKSR